MKALYALVFLPVIIGAGAVALFGMLYLALSRDLKFLLTAIR